MSQSYHHLLPAITELVLFLFDFSFSFSFLGSPPHHHHHHHHHAPLSLTLTLSLCTAAVFCSWCVSFSSNPLVLFSLAGYKSLSLCVSQGQRERVREVKYIPTSVGRVSTFVLLAQLLRFSFFLFFSGSWVNWQGLQLGINNLPSGYLSFKF